MSTSEDRRPTRVYVIDAHPLWRSSIGALLAANGFELAGGSAPSDALSATAIRSADVVLIDPPDQNPGAFVREVLAKVATTARIVVLSSSSPTADVLRELAGLPIAAFLTKSAQPADMLSAIEQRFSSDLILLPRKPLLQLLRDDAVEALSGREHEILVQVAQGRTNAEIARKLGLSEPTIKSHLSNVFRKVRASNRIEAIRQAELLGLLAPQESMQPPEGSS